MNSFKKYLFPVLLFVFYLIEGVSKYYLLYDAVKIDVTRYLRLFIFIFIFILFIYQKKYKFLFYPIILFVFYITGQYLMGFSYLSLESIIVYSKYIYILFLLEFSFDFFKKTKNKLFFSAFELVIIVNSLLIILGILFKIHLFETYSGVRFGYNGLFITSATSSYFYMIALFYIFINYSKPNQNYILNSLVIIAALIIGTKAVYLFSALLVLFYFIYYKSIENLLKRILTLTLFISIIVIALLVFVPSFLEIIKTYGLLSAILSYRDLLFIENTLPFVHENWSTLNYLIGGQGLFKDRTQMGFIDLFLFFGLFGSTIYLYTYYKTMFKNKINANSLFIIISFVIVIFLGGNFFYSATISFYLIILQQILYTHTNDNISL